jgi:hypothetical protein
MTPIERQGGPRRPAWRAWPVLAAFLVPLALGLAGCSDTPDNCLVQDEGFLSFEILPEGNDTFTARFVSVRDLLTSPPTVRYRFQKDGGGEVFLDTPDLVGYRFDLVVGRTYTVVGEEVIDSNLEAYALTLSDSLGVAALVESDWQGKNNRPDQLYDYVFKDGYPVDGLTVNFEDSGCESREALTSRFQSITNWNLVFALTGEGTVTAAHRRTFRLGTYEFHVFRAERREPKVEEEIQPQLSWVLRRIDS